MPQAADPHGIHEFNEAGWIPNIIEHVWDMNAIVSETSVFGELLKTLFGYNGNPSLTEIIGYAAYLATVMFLFTRSNAKREIQAVQPQA